MRSSPDRQLGPCRHAEVQCSMPVPFQHRWSESYMRTRPFLNYPTKESMCIGVLLQDIEVPRSKGHYQNLGSSIIGVQTLAVKRRGFAGGAGCIVPQRTQRQPIHNLASAVKCSHILYRAYRLDRHLTDACERYISQDNLDTNLRSLLTLLQPYFQHQNPLLQ